MTPQEEAREIFDYYLNFRWDISTNEAKELSIFTVNKIIENLEDHTGKEIEYFNEVIYEINAIKF
jgi:hypothetical protein